VNPSRQAGEARLQDPESSEAGERQELQSRNPVESQETRIQQARNPGRQVQKLQRNPGSDPECRDPEENLSSRNSQTSWKSNSSPAGGEKSGGRALPLQIQATSQRGTGRSSYRNYGRKPETI